MLLDAHCIACMVCVFILPAMHAKVPMRKVCHVLTSHAGVNCCMSVLCRYQEARGRLMQCRHPSDVAKLDKQLAAEWSWLQEVRRNTAAAVDQCTKQVGHVKGLDYGHFLLHADVTLDIP
jgi:hypothetical protein